MMLGLIRQCHPESLLLNVNRPCFISGSKSDINKGKHKNCFLNLL